MMDRLWLDILEREPHVFAAFGLHLHMNSSRDHIAWLQLVGEALALCIEKDRAFAAT